jgi:hypothetical protein
MAITTGDRHFQTHANGHLASFTEEYIMSVELLEAVLYYQINGIFRKENWLLRDPKMRLKALVRKGGGQ